MKNFSLNADQKILVEKNLSVVRFAIHKNIIVNDNLYGFEYDDLYQEGCIWLCKAALSYNESRDVKFATYAEKVVTNGLRTYCRLMCGKQKHHVSLPVQTDPDTDDFSLEQIPADDPLDKIFEEQKSKASAVRRSPECIMLSPIWLAHGFQERQQGSNKMKALCNILTGLLKLTAPMS